MRAISTSPADAAKTPMAARKPNLSLLPGPSSFIFSALISHSRVSNSFSSSIIRTSSFSPSKSYFSKTFRIWEWITCWRFRVPKYASRDAMDFLHLSRAFCVCSLLTSNAARVGEVETTGGGGVLETVTSWIVAAPRPSTLRGVSCFRMSHHVQPT